VSAIYPDLEQDLSLLQRKSVLVSEFHLALGYALKKYRSISNTVTGGPIVNQIAAALSDRIIQAAKAGQKFKVCLSSTAFIRLFIWGLQVIVVIPVVPAFAGTIIVTSALQIIMAAQWRTINRGGASIMVRRNR
jgi:hypothetical protein